LRASGAFVFNPVFILLELRRWGDALLVNIPGGRPRYDVLGILDEETSVVVEVKNMKPVRDFYEFKEGILPIAKRTESLQTLLNDA